MFWDKCCPAVLHGFCDSVTKPSHVLLSHVPIAFPGSAPEPPTTLVLAGSAHSALGRHGIYVQNILKNVEVTILILKERRNRRKDKKTSSHVVKNEVSSVQVHCHVDSFTIKCRLFVAKAGAVGFFFQCTTFRPRVKAFRAPRVLVFSFQGQYTEKHD